MSSMKLYYWPIKARNYATQAVAQAGGLKLELVSDFDFPELKKTLPFGQLPYLVDGDVKIAQSNAILRYVARKAGLDGSDSDDKFGLSEMLIEESTDISNLIGKANYAHDKIGAYNDLFAAGGAMEKQLAFLESLHPGDSPFFRSDKRCVGGFAIAATLDIVVSLEPTALDNFPKLKGFHAAMLSSSAFDGIRDLPMYFSRSV